MDEISLKIKIADREYPMKVKLEEEEKVREAAKVVNERLKVFRNQFGIDDKQDLLAMVAFDCMVKYLEADDSTMDQEEVSKQLEALNHKIEQSL